MLNFHAQLLGLLALATSSLAAPTPDAVTAAATQKFEAESATLSGTEVLTELSGYSG